MLSVTEGNVLAEDQFPKVTCYDNPTSRGARIPQAICIINISKNSDLTPDTGLFEPWNTIEKKYERMR
jgi:hypothetical protein